MKFQTVRPYLEYAAVLAVLIGITLFAGCGQTPQADSGEGKVGAASKLPVFNLAASEYPSWSTYAVAARAGLVNEREGGKHGPLEEKWGVDVVLHMWDYDPCINALGNGTVDAACITNIDSLNVVLGRPCTVILPTSTSAGGDKVIYRGNPPTFATRNGNLKAMEVKAVLNGKKTYGLSKSVSEYVWFRGLQVNELDPKQYQFVHLDPGAAATALQSGSESVQVICVWNPFAMQTLRSTEDSHVLFDSTVCPEEVIDMVVMGNDSLKKPGGEAFAKLLADIFYSVSDRLNYPQTADATYKALGENFLKSKDEATLLADMKQACKDTRFYATPASGIKLFQRPDFEKEKMTTVIDTCKSINILATVVPSLGFDDPSKQLNFSTKFMEAMKNRSELAPAP